MRRVISARNIFRIKSGNSCKIESGNILFVCKYNLLMQLRTHHIAENFQSLIRRQLTESNFFLLACLLCTLPVWLPHFPPMADLPQHAALISLFLNLGNPDFPFSNEFQLNLFTPYLLGYFLISVFSPLLGIVAASKLVISFALAAFALASRFLLRQTGADPYWAWLTFPVLFGFAYQWGLLNFLIAAPVGILFLGLVWKKGAHCDVRSSLLIVLMLYVLFFCHALIMGLFILIALGYWALSVRRLGDFVKCAWPVVALIPLVIGWFLLASQHSEAHHPIRWDLSWINTSEFYYSYAASWANTQEPGWGRVTGFLPRMLGVRPGLFLTLFGIILFILPFLAGGRVTKSRPRRIPFLVITLLLLFLPSVLLGNSFTVQRFALFALPLFLVAVDKPNDLGDVKRDILRFLAPLIAFGWIVFMSINALKFDEEAEGFDVVLSNMEPHKRAVSLIFSRDDANYIAPPFLHFSSWYSAIKGGITNPSFAVYSGMPVGYKDKYFPRIQMGFAWQPQSFDWQEHEGYKYDYFVVRAPDDVIRSADCRVEMVRHAGQWWLYRLHKKC